MRTYIQKGYGVYANGRNYFARMQVDTAIELTDERSGNDVFGYIDNTDDAVSRYLPAGKIKVRTLESSIVEK